MVMPRSAGAFPAFSLTQVDHLGAVSEPCHHIVRVVSCIIGPCTVLAGFADPWIPGCAHTCSCLRNPCADAVPAELSSCEGLENG